MKTLHICQNINCNIKFYPCSGSLGKFCSLRCSNIQREQIKRANKENEYSINPKKCKLETCNNTIKYKYRNEHNFCSLTCGAIYTNKRKDWSKIKTGPTKLSAQSDRDILKFKLPKFILPKLKECIICNNIHSRKGRSCSDKCYSVVISNAVRGKTGGNRDINKAGIDSYGNKFYFDSKWEIKLADDLNLHNIKWMRPKRFILSNGRSYTPDFYLPEHNIYVDPKAKRPNYYRNSILKIEMFEKEFKQKCFVISDPKLLTWYHLQTMMLVNNFRS